MKRLVAFVGAVIFVALVGCGQPPPPENPTIKLDRDSIGFGQEFGSGTYIGTMPQESLNVMNQGQNDLVISTVELTGDSVFTFDTASPTPITVKGLKNTFVRVVFAPTAEKNYSATLKISSNDPVTPVKEVPVTGRGLTAPDAGP